MDAGPEFYYPRMLCGQRLDNQGSFTARTFGLPHTCILDVAIVPIATWALLLLVLLWIPFALKSRTRSTETRAAIHRYRYTKTLAGDEKSTQAAQKWPKTTVFFGVLYTLLVLASLLMNVLEIVRLYLAHREAGLLPFTLGGILIVLILMHVRTSVTVRPYTGLICLIFWTISLALTSLKFAVLVKLQDIEPRIGGYQDEYHDADQIIDVAVIIGLYAGFFLGELFRLPSLFLAAKHARSHVPAGSARSDVEGVAPAPVENKA